MSAEKQFWIVAGLFALTLALAGAWTLGYLSGKLAGVNWCQEVNERIERRK